MPDLGVVAFRSPMEVGADRADQAVMDVVRRLESAGCKTLNAGVVDNPAAAVSVGRRFAEAHVHAIVMVSASWFEDYLALDLLEECGVPLLLWSLPGMQTGALCGMQQLSFALKELGIYYQTVFGHASDEKLSGSIDRFAKVAALYHRLRRARIGMAGHHVSGMTDAAVNELALKKTLGPRVVQLDMTDLMQRAASVETETASRRWESLVGKAGNCSVSGEEGIDSMQVLCAFEEQIAQHELDAAAVGCYPHLMGRVCLAASVLADRGIPLACEGDINAAVAQLILMLLTAQPTHNTDWLEPLEDGTVVFSHCGNGSFSLAEHPDSIELANVRLMNNGACALFSAKPGPVTLLNLVPHGDGYQIALLEGTAISTEMVFPGNPLRVQFDATIDVILEWVHEHGIGHHWMGGYGHVGREIIQLARLSGPGLQLVSGPT